MDIGLGANHFAIGGSEEIVVGSVSASCSATIEQIVYTDLKAIGVVVDFIFYTHKSPRAVVSHDFIAKSDGLTRVGGRRRKIIDGPKSGGVSRRPEEITIGIFKQQPAWIGVGKVV